MKKNKIPNSYKGKDVELNVTGPLNDKGYCETYDENERKIYLLDALPGEKVIATATRKKKGVLYAKVKQVLSSSSSRKNPLSKHFMASTPWEILDKNKENEVKKKFLQDYFQGILPHSILDSIQIDFNSSEYKYRNKVEFSFFGHDDESLSLAFFMRGNNRIKIPFKESPIVPENVNSVANKIIDFLESKQITAKNLKFLMMRYSFHEENVIVSLYTSDKDLEFKEEELQNLLDENLKGIRISYTDPRTPASQTHQVLAQKGELTLKEKISNKVIEYGIDQFFQVNPPAFETALEDMKLKIQEINQKEGWNPVLVDMFAGVGTLGILLSDLSYKIIGVESVEGSKNFAISNAEENKLKNFEFVEKNVEEALEYLEEADILLFDPPREGIGKNTIEKVKDVLPKYIIYLSCNPKTQASDISYLLEYYTVEFMKGYNFFPHTPHIESMIILKRKN